MKRYTTDYVLAAIRKEVEASSLRQTAYRYGIDPGQMSKLLNGREPISEKIAEAFGFQRVEETKVWFLRKSAA